MAVNSKYFLQKPTQADSHPQLCSLNISDSVAHPLYYILCLLPHKHGSLLNPETTLLPHCHHPVLDSISNCPNSLYLNHFPSTVQGRKVFPSMQHTGWPMVVLNRYLLKIQMHACIGIISLTSKKEK